MKPLKNKIVLITGSSIGIGRETAYLCSKEGARLVITYYRDQQEAEQTVQKCRELGAADILLIKLDVTDQASIENAVKEVIAKFGGIDILINNAGVICWKILQEQTYSEIEKQINVNLTGLIKMTKVALPHIKDLIINISSGSGRRGYPQLTTYCATKFAVRGFTKALAEETDVKVISVNPPLTSTRMSGYKGTPVDYVAGIIKDTTINYDSIESGSDVDIERK
jgi:NAD(P)-dependent dehydrogenase (short-subunit alcohol dehydrogenase family)